MRIFDTFPMNDELDMLECRLTELEEVRNLTHVIVEASVTHQDNPKPSHYLDNRERFTKWADRIVHVWADDLPTIKDDPDPWAREHAQREHAIHGLRNAEADDVVLHGDLDEIPRALLVRNARPTGLIAFGMRLHCFAVDWFHPEMWRGTVASKVGNMARLGRQPFGAMRDSRNFAPCPPAFRDGGWHLSWMGGRDAQLRKLGAFCHPEIADKTLEGLQGDVFYQDGLHVDGTIMEPLDVDEGWPKWVREGHAPTSWFRPR